eukprot:8415925-Pyramimonas_sp.AAC.1
MGGLWAACRGRVGSGLPQASHAAENVAAFVALVQFPLTGRLIADFQGLVGVTNLPARRPQPCRINPARPCLA